MIRHIKSCHYPCCSTSICNTGKGRLFGRKRDIETCGCKIILQMLHRLVPLRSGCCWSHWPVKPRSGDTSSLQACITQVWVQNVKIDRVFGVRETQELEKVYKEATITRPELERLILGEMLDRKERETRLECWCILSGCRGSIRPDLRRVKVHDTSRGKRVQ